MRYALLLLFCLTTATAAPVPKGTEEKAKLKDADEAAKAARYKALREGYEAQRDSLPKGSLDRAILEQDMNEARNYADTRVKMEKIVDQKVKARMVEGWETCGKPCITNTPRRKELYEIYVHELSQKK